jgi:hypothetical protein
VRVLKQLQLSEVVLPFALVFFGGPIYAQTQSASTQSTQTQGSQTSRVSKPCETPVSAVKAWCSEKAEYEAEADTLTTRLLTFTNGMAELGGTSAAANTLAQTYETGLKAQIDALHDITSKIEDIVEITLMLPGLGDETADATVQLAQIRVDLATAVAKYESSKYTPAAPKKNPASNAEDASTEKGGQSGAAQSIVIGAPPANSGVSQPQTGGKTTNSNTKDSTKEPNPASPQTPPAAGSVGVKPETPPTVSVTPSTPGNNAGIIINATSVGNTATAATNSATQPNAPPAAPGTTPKSGTKKKTADVGGDGAKKGAGGSKDDSKDPNSGGKGTGDSTKNSTPGATGVLTGRILDYDTQNPIPKAIVIARCGDNGQYIYTTRTDVLGRYIFLYLPVGNCLVRAAKWLSPVETDEAQSEWTVFRDTALTTASKQNPLPRASIFARYKAKYAASRLAANELPEKDWAYEEDTLNNLEVTAGGQTIATDLLLHKRTNAVGEFARTIVGFQQSGANSADSAQRFFLDLWLSTPSPFNVIWQDPWKTDPNFGSRLRFWGDVRITSTPQQIQSSLGDFVVGFAGQVAALKVNQVAQSAELMGGGEFRLFKWGATNNRLLSFDSSARERFALYFTLGGGFTTPIEPLSFTQVFVNPTPGTEPNFDNQIAKLGLTNQIAGKEFIAFVSQDRAKFLGQFYGGIRTKTFYYDRYTDEPLRRFPATLDVLIGQNQSVTGGIYRHAVLRLDGFYPLPYQSAKFVYLFGTSDLVLGGPRGETPILLQAGTNAPPIPDPSIFLMPPLRQLNRDQYRIGAGIDIIQLIDSIKSINANKPTTGKPSKPGAETSTSASDSSN